MKYLQQAFSWKIKEGGQLDNFDEPDEHTPLDLAQMVQAGIVLYGINYTSLINSGRKLNYIVTLRIPYWGAKRWSVAGWFKKR